MKKFAPTLSLDSGCPHRYSDDEEVQLEVDCSGCAGAHDLGNSKCLARIMNVLCAGLEPEAIILERFIHKRYRGEAVRRTLHAAAELAALNRAIVAAETPSDKRCRTCPASTEMVVTAMKRRLLQDPAGYLESRDSIVREIEIHSLTRACTRTQECVRRAVSMGALRGGKVQ